MSKKDFQIIAELIGQVLEICKAGRQETEDSLDYVTECLKYTNPLFDKEKFIEAVSQWH